MFLRISGIGHMMLQQQQDRQHLHLVLPKSGAFRRSLFMLFSF
jgi:hypothetical protein